MKQYSKGKLKLKRATFVLIMIFLVMLVCGIILLFAFCLNDRIEIDNQISDAINVSDDVSSNSKPIIIDNLIVGATYEKKWVSSNKYFLKSNFKTDIDIAVYTDKTKAGTYKMKDTYTSDDSVYANTSYPNNIDEYFAISENNDYALSSQFREIEISKEDYSSVKKALGIYRIYNNSLNIKNVYEGFININTPVKIISVTNSKKGIFGGIYSAIVIVNINTNATQLLQYSYTKDIDNSDDFPLYSVKFLSDLNGDGNCEIVTRDVTEFNVTYNVFEYQNNKFLKVLSETMKGK